MHNRMEHEDGIQTIHLQQPEDFIYDIDDVVVRYNPADGTVLVDNEAIPASIRGNMERFFRGDIEEYTSFLEKNLEVFFGGRDPECMALRKHELPRDHPFPVDAKTHLNVGFEAEKRNVFIVVCAQPNVQVECSRCARTTQMEETMDCPGCRSRMEMKYTAAFSPEFLGFLGLQKCRFICFNPARYQISCDRCSTNYETDPLGAGASFHLRCYGCSADMALRIARIEFVQQKKESLKAGQALPDKGTCRHYRKSYRWFRFPCCRSLYPCDICHDEQSGHAHQIANKMVCGLCSREQSVRKECECGMNLKKTTSFWEGGKGSRDKGTMSRKDRKKYTK